MKILRVLILRALPFILLTIGAGLNATAQPAPGDVEKALAFLRQLDPAKVRPADHEKVAGQINAAWRTIQKAGANGRAQLKQEIARPGHSDYFRLNGAALLWAIAGLDEAETIAGVWRSTRLEVQSNYVFYPAFQAANTHDDRALPMLLAVLGNNKFKIYVQLHSMEVDWPRTMHFIWGAYGPKRLPVLLEALKKSQSPVELQSALFLFANDQYLEALPRIRELAGSDDGETRRAAIYALGFYGHPQDYDFLIAGLKSPNAEDRFYFAMAVYEYEDLRAVPHLIPLLNDSDQKVRGEAVANLAHLLTVQSVDAIREYLQRSRGEEKPQIEGYLQSEFKQYGLNLADYKSRSPAEKTKMIDAMRRKREDSRVSLSAGEKALTRDEFLKSAEAGKKNHRFPLGAREILAAATPNDINLLLEVKAAVFSRLSDECLSEAKEIDVAIRRLGRSRYRKEVGITEKVEAP